MEDFHHVFSLLFSPSSLTHTHQKTSDCRYHVIGGDFQKQSIFLILKILSERERERDGILSYFWNEKDNICG